MEVWFSPTRRVAVVAPRGEVDLRRTDDLRRALLQACEAERLVVVDLSEVTFIDSSGLGVIVGAMRRLQRREAELKIVNARGEPLRAICATGLGMLVSPTG